MLQIIYAQVTCVGVEEICPNVATKKQKSHKRPIEIFDKAAAAEYNFRVGKCQALLTTVGTGSVRRGWRGGTGLLRGRSVRIAHHLENVADVGVRRLVPLDAASPMKLVQLFHLKVSERSDVLEQGESVSGAEAAQRAVVELGLRRHVGAGLEQVTKKKRRGLVPRRRGVQGQFVSAVGVIVARVAT